MEITQRTFVLQRLQILETRQKERQALSALICRFVYVFHRDTEYRFAKTRNQKELR